MRAGLTQALGAERAVSRSTAASSTWSASDARTFVRCLAVHPLRPYRMRARASLASRCRVSVTVAGAWSRRHFRPRGCGFGGQVLTSSSARPVPRSSVGLASSSGPSLSGVVSRLTIRSSRTRFAASAHFRYLPPRCSPIDRAAGRLNSGVRPHGKH